MLQDEYQRIAQLEYDHWWYRSLHNLVAEVIEKHFKDKGIKIIDAGCGTGGLISFLHSRGYTNIKGFDLSETALDICQSRGIPVFKSDLREIERHFDKGDANIIISNDTFYFLDYIEQKKLASDVHQLLHKDGLLIANMPALKAFKGIHDRQVGIRKRFEPGDIWEIFDPAKYDLVRKMYWPFLLSPAIWLSRAVQRIKLRLNPLTAIRSDLSRQRDMINSILFGVTRTENRVMGIKPFGSSLFLVLKKK